MELYDEEDIVRARIVDICVALKDDVTLMARLEELMFIAYKLRRAADLQ